MDRRAFLAASAGLVLAPLAGTAGTVLKMRDLYNKDLSFSDFARSHQSKRVSVTGYMAPPLKAETNFFVLTKLPMATCPFCESEAEWPDDILVVYADDIISVIPFNSPIIVTGTLELGTRTDEALGFVSRVRLTSASFEKM